MTTTAGEAPGTGGIAPNLSMENGTVFSNAPDEPSTMKSPRVGSRPCVGLEPAMPLAAPALAVLLTLAMVLASGRVTQAQNQQRPAADDPFAEELNPFPSPDKEQGKPRPGRTRKDPPKKDDGADSASPPGEGSPSRGSKGGEDAEPAARPRAKPMPSGVDLLPFPDIGAPDAGEDSPAMELLAKAEKLDRRGRHEAAKKVILEAIDLDPKLPIARLALGIVCRHMGDFEGSLEACSAGLRLDDTDAELYLRRGIAWFHLGRYGIALEDFEDAAGIAYDDPRAELWRGLTLMELGRPLEAISAYSAAVRRDRTYDIAYLNRGLAYLATNEPSKAESDFDQAIRHDPRDARAWFNRGVAQARQAEYANAADSYEAALRIDPGHVGARRNLDAVRSRVGAREMSRATTRRSAPAEMVPSGRPASRSGGATRAPSASILGD